MPKTIANVLELVVSLWADPEKPAAFELVRTLSRQTAISDGSNFRINKITKLQVLSKIITITWPKNAN